MSEEQWGTPLTMGELTQLCNLLGSFFITKEGAEFTDQLMFDEDDAVDMYDTLCAIVTTRAINEEDAAC